MRESVSENRRTDVHSSTSQTSFAHFLVHCACVRQLEWCYNGPPASTSLPLHTIGMATQLAGKQKNNNGTVMQQLIRYHCAREWSKKKKNDWKKLNRSSPHPSRYGIVFLLNDINNLFLLRCRDENIIVLTFLPYINHFLEVDIYLYHLHLCPLWNIVMMMNTKSQQYKYVLAKIIRRDDHLQCVPRVRGEMHGQPLHNRQSNIIFIILLMTLCYCLLTRATLHWARELERWWWWDSNPIRSVTSHQRLLYVTKHICRWHGR